MSKPKVASGNAFADVLDAIIDCGITIEQISQETGISIEDLFRLYKNSTDRSSFEQFAEVSRCFKRNYLCNQEFNF